MKKVDDGKEQTDESIIFEDDVLCPFETDDDSATYIQKMDQRVKDIQSGKRKALSEEEFLARLKELNL